MRSIIRDIIVIALSLMIFKSAIFGEGITIGIIILTLALFLVSIWFILEKIGIL